MLLGQYFFYKSGIEIASLFCKKKQPFFSPSDLNGFLAFLGRTYLTILVGICQRALKHKTIIKSKVLVL